MLFAEEDYQKVVEFFRSLPGYSPTPLRSVPALAKELGVEEVLIKDESRRLGLPAFKILGVLYAIDSLYRTGSVTRNSVLVCATDGNHGRALAHVARQYGLAAKVYIHKGAAPSRVQAIAAEGAEVIVVDGNYDDSVQQAAEAAETNGWTLFSDTSWPGNETVPTLIMAGYTMLMSEAAEQWERIPDVVMVQAGVGGLACAVVSWLSYKCGSKRPQVVCCEPEAAACVLESVRAGRPTSVAGALETIMAGLSCGTISSLAWPILRIGVDACITVSDVECLEALRKLAYPGGKDPEVRAGESGACGLAALASILACPSFLPLRQSLHLDRASRIFLINTEGITDPEGYYRATGRRPE
jgi:diaminopropionate ammonia-lyase